MNIIEAIYARRSVRKFTDRPVEKEKLEELCRLGAAGPSAMNHRPWAFVVIDDPEQLKKMRTSTMFGHFGAPAAIVMCGDVRKETPGARGFWIQDCSAGMENILLGCVELGLGAVWIGVTPVKPAMWFLSKALGLPRHVKPLGIAYIGYPAEEKEARTQLAEGMVKWQKWG